VTSETEDVLKKAPPSFTVIYRGALAKVDKGGQTLKNLKPQDGRR
jgi:hypothetical protein